MAAPALRKRFRVTHCATLTADGKLAKENLALPSALLQGGGSSGRHPWATHFDRVGAVIVDQRLVEALALTQKFVRPLLLVASERTLDLELAKLQLARLGGAVWCFGGEELFRALLERGAVDELFLCVLPRIDGRRGSAALSGAGSNFFPVSVACRLVRMEVRGDECLLHYRVRRCRETGARVV